MRSSIFALVIASAVSCSPKGTPPSSGTSSGGGSSPGSPSESSSTAGTSDTSGGSGGTATAPAGKAEPIDGKLPEPPKVPKFSRRSECPATGCNLKRLVPDDVKFAADDKSPILMYEAVLPRKSMSIVPKHSGVDVYGLLLEGEVSVMADDIKDKQKRIWPWMAFRAPGGGVNIFAKEPTRVVLAIVATAKDTSAAQAIDAITQKAGSVMWGKRPSPVVSVELIPQTDVAWGGGAYHVRYAFEGDAVSASLEVLLTSKNAPIAEHTHDKEWEAIAVVDGEGTLFKKNGDVAVSPGTMFTIPPGVSHGMKPAGTAPLLAIQMYAPPGPEQRFKKLAAESK